MYNFKYISDKKNEIFKYMLDRYSNSYRNYEQGFKAYPHRSEDDHIHAFFYHLDASITQLSEPI